MLIRRKLLILAGAMGMFFAPGLAVAQQPFSPEALSASNLTAAQRGQIEAFVNEVVAGLGSGDAVQIMTARRVAQRELARPEVRVPFRLDFASVATPKLAELAKNPNDLAAINAIYILGDMATGESSVALLDSLKDERESVRYAAAVGLEKAFTAPNAVVPRRDLDVLRRQLAVRLAAEQSPKVVTAYVRMLAAAADPARCTVEEMRPIAITLLGTTFADRLVPLGGEAVDGPTMDAMLVAGETLRGELTRVGATTPDQQVKDAARLGGHLLAYVRRRALAGDIGSNEPAESVRTERQNLQTLAQLGEQITIFAGTKRGKSVPPPGLPALIAQNRDAEFIDKSLDLIGPEGVLTAPPFGFADNEFIKD